MAAVSTEVASAEVSQPAALSAEQLGAINAFWDGLEPEPMLTVSQWADQHRILSSQASAEPGRWRTSRTPYLQEIMDALSANSPYEEVDFMAAAQIGKTEGGNNWLGYIIDHCPGPVLYVMPTVEIAKRTSRQRIAPMIAETPRLVEKVKDARSRDSGNTMLMKDFPGGLLIITGANSAAGLRSMPIRFLFMDEVDAYPDDVDGEGSPIELAEARTRTFSRRKVFKVSTPTYHGRSNIESAYEASDKRRYYVPCPHCGHMDWIKWKNIQWPKGKPRKAALMCEDCGALIEEHYKTTMLAGGEWRAENPGAGDGKIAGFHLSALYSPVGWYSWGDAARYWDRSNKNPEKLRVFVNTVLGETWKEKGEAPEWRRLYERRVPYQINTIPDSQVLFLTAGADVQGGQNPRIEVEVIGWGRGLRSWSIDYRVFAGDVSDHKAGAWLELERLLSEQWLHPGGVQMPLRILAVDSGFNTQVVYNWCRKQANPARVVPVKGSDTQQFIIGRPSAVDVTADGRKIARGMRLWNVGATLAKGELYGWLQQEAPLAGEPYPGGWCEFPEYDEEFFKQLTGERRVTKLVRGYRRYVWEQHYAQVEALDCRVYGRAAAAIVGIDRWKEDQWRELEQQLAVREPDKPEPGVTGERHGVKMKKSSYWDKSR